MFNKFSKKINPNFEPERREFLIKSGKATLGATIALNIPTQIFAYDKDKEKFYDFVKKYKKTQLDILF